VGRFGRQLESNDDDDNDDDNDDDDDDDGSSSGGSCSGGGSGSNRDGSVGGALSGDIVDSFHVGTRYMLFFGFNREKVCQAGLCTSHVRQVKATRWK
jgi:hypothetical protein